MKKNKYIFLFASVIAAQFFGSCNEESIDKVNAPIPYESIGGYESSDAVAADHLVSKFSFDGNFTDSKSNMTGFVGTNTGFGDGIKGNAYLGSSSEARYAIGDATSKITGLNSFTISFWMNTANTVDPATPGQGKGAQGIFSIVRPLEFWGGLNVFLENPDSAFPDRLRVKLDVENGRTDVVWRSQAIIMNIDNSLNTWVHVVLCYNSATSTVSCYTNGVLSTSAIWYANDPGGSTNPNNAPKYGNFEMVGTNGKVVFGTHQFETIPPLNNGSQQDWATSFVGLMDEFRIYDVALSVNDVKALYLLEKDNR